MNGPADELSVRIDSTEVADAEVAAVTAAVVALAATSPTGADGATGDGSRSGASVWRAAALLEATDGRRLGSRAALDRALGR